MALGRDLVVGVLEQLEIPFVFGHPGATESPLIDGLASHPKVRYTRTLHDDVAVGMAMGYGRASGSIGVAALELAPGLAHGLGNLFNAWNARIPLVVFATQQHTHQLIHEPPLAADLVAMARPCTKWAHEVRHVDELPTVLQRAFKLAVAPPAGPVCLSMPTDVMLAETAACPPRVSQIGSGTRADEVELTRGASLLAGAESPLIIAGDGVGLGDAWPELVTLAERLGAPVYTDASATAWNFPNRHAHWQGPLPTSAQAIRDLFGDVDAVLLSGLDATGFLVPPHVQIVAVHDNPWELAKNQAVSAGILGDVKLNLTALLSALRATSQPRSALAAATRRRAALSQHAQQRQSEWEQRASAAGEQTRLTATRVAAEVAQLLPRDAIVADESLSSRLPFLHLLEFSSPRAYWSSERGGLGATMSAALGMSLAHPQRVIVNLIDAGVFVYCPQALWSAAGSIVFVVLNVGSSHTAGLDIVSVARGMRVDAERVVEPSDLRPTLERALSSGRPHLLDVAIDPLLDEVVDVSHSHVGVVA